jgi:hypothetical protein
VLNWHTYNESLVRRGEIVLDFDVKDNWKNELANMNNGKDGASMYTQILLSNYLSICVYIFIYRTGRQTEGAVKAHVKGKLASTNPRLQYNPEAYQ